MVGNLTPMGLEPDQKDGAPGVQLYKFLDRHYADEVNERMSPERLPTIAKSLIDALEANAGLELPIAILVDGKYDKLDTKLLSFLGNLGAPAIKKLTNLFKRAEQHSREHGRVGILFGVCYDPDIGDVQVSIPNVFQTGLIPVVITAGDDVFTIITN